MRILSLLLVLLISSCARSPRTDAEIVRRGLREGGLIVLFAPTEAVHLERLESPSFAVSDCATHPELSASGRAQAKLIGLHFRENEFPVRDVYVGLHCHAAETARLAFPEHRAVRVGALTPVVGASQEQIQVSEAVLRRLLGEGEARRGNVVMLADPSVLHQVTGVEMEGGRGVVIRPIGHAHFDFVGYTESLF